MPSPESPAPARPPNTVSRTIERLRAGAWTREADALAAEEPMEIRIAWQDDAGPHQRSIAVTMRTPGDDFELAVGFLYGEQILGTRNDVVDVAYCIDEAEDQAFNIVTVTLRPGLAFGASRLERNFFTNSSCGVCGKATLEALEFTGCLALEDTFSVPGDVVRRLPAGLREHQRIFESTGGLHASGLFDGTGQLSSLKEDVGRHNALDKLVGERFLADQLPLPDSILCLSGRASYELLQKALVARIPVVAAVGAPSSLAVDLARAFNITLLGFVRGDGFNVYSGRERVIA